MNGDHGQIVQQHVVKESKQGQEHVLMMLKTLASHSLSKKVALLPQPAGVHGQIALQHAIVVLKQEQEPVLTIKEVPLMSQKLTKKLVKFKNAVMTLGLHGVAMVHVLIMVPDHLNNNDREADSSKFLRVHKKANQFNTNMKRSNVIIMAIGVKVSSKRSLFIKHFCSFRNILRQRSCKYDYQVSKWM